MAAILSVYDYIVFALMLVLSSVIGVYYGIKGKQTSTREYLAAGGSMHWVPISISLMASFMSAVGLMGIPAETYTYGIQFFMTYFSFVIIILFSAWLYAPVFYRSQVTSSNEYLERRFSPAVRLIGCIFFILQYVLYLSVAIFAPSLALQAVADVPLVASIICTGAICTFYTTLGGMRGVVWTDVFQATVMMIGLIVVIVVGTNDVGGIGQVIEKAEEGKRSKLFDFNPDPRVRDSFWTLVIGSAISLLPAWTTSQVSVQRFIAASSLRNVRRALYWNLLFLFITLGLCSFAGLVMYAFYADCDPRKDGKIKSNDQIIPYFVVNRLSNLTCVPGLYMACLFSGALSTVSSGLNSLAAVTSEDIVKKIYPNMSDKRATVVSKCIACGYGVLVISLAFLVSIAGTMVLQLVYTIHGVVAAPCFAVFTLGMVFPRANSKGVCIGLTFGVAMALWIVVGAIFYPGNKRPAPISVHKCHQSNSTANATAIPQFLPYTYKGYDFPLANLYGISHFWYGGVGALTTFIVGMIASLIFYRKDDAKLDPILFFNFKEDFFSMFPTRGNRYNMEDKDGVEMKRMADDTDENTNKL